MLHEFCGVNILQNTQLWSLTKNPSTPKSLYKSMSETVFQLFYHWSLSMTTQLAYCLALKMCRFRRQICWALRSACLLSPTFPTTYCHFGEKIYHCPAAFWSAHELISPQKGDSAIFLLWNPRLAEEATNDIPLLQNLRKMLKDNWYIEKATHLFPGACTMLQRCWNCALRSLVTPFETLIVNSGTRFHGQKIDSS